MSVIALSQPPSTVAGAPMSYWRTVAWRLSQDRATLVAGTLLLLIALSAVLAPWIAPHDPSAGSIRLWLAVVGAPSHVLGTDEQGRDMLTRLLYGGRLSLLTGMLPVIVATVIGTAIGATAAYLRGLVGAVLMRTMDMLYAFPAIMFAIAISASLGPGVTNSVLAISVVFIAPISRVAEAATRRVIFLEYIDAARLSGASTAHILRSQVLPNIFNPIFVYASGLIGLSIVIASGLSFLGMGARPPVPEWGFMLNSLRGVIYVQPWVAALPGFLIFATSVSCNMLSDALRDALDIRDA
jgi:peptide/nickel transport system permease protein